LIGTRDDLHMSPMAHLLFVIMDGLEPPTSASQDKPLKTSCHALPTELHDRHSLNKTLLLSLRLRFFLLFRFRCIWLIILRRSNLTSFRINIFVLRGHLMDIRVRNSLSIL